MREVLNIVPKVYTNKDKLINAIWLWFGVAIFVSALYLSSFLMIIIAAVLIYVWYSRSYRCNIEFEYTYFDNEVVFARIKNKASRKVLAKVNLDEATIIAPEGAYSLNQYEQGPKASAKVRQYNSGVGLGQIYKLVYRVGRTTEMIVFEPDENFLSAIRIKYPQLIEKGV